jgi:tetrahydromethanopterin S-methyltransferase subunit E
MGIGIGIDPCVALRGVVSCQGVDHSGAMQELARHVVGDDVPLALHRQLVTLAEQVRRRSMHTPLCTSRMTRHSWASAATREEDLRAS